MLGFNAQCDDLKNKIVEDINDAKLPITVTYYILQEILTAAERQKEESITNEHQEFLKERISENKGDE